MSTINTSEKIEYSESDGQPMGETEVHRRWMVRVDDILCHRLRGQRVYVGCNLLLYFFPGHPARFLVPDNFVVLDCDPHERRFFKTWEEQRVPDVVIEVTSQSTQSDDLVRKLALYEEMRVREYFLYDPTASYLKPPLQGFRLENGLMTPLEPLDANKLTCQVLGLELQLDELDLVISDSLTGEILRTEAEDNWRQATAERQRADAEEAKRLAAERRIAELEELLKKSRESP